MRLHALCVKRTTIRLPDDLDERLRYEARRRDASVADIAREALRKYLPELQDDGRLSFFGVGNGLPPDVSERVDEYVGKAVRRRRGVERSA